MCRPCGVPKAYARRHKHFMQFRCRYLDPLAWGLYGIIVTQMGAVTQTVELSDGGHVSISSYLLQTYNYDYSFCWQVRCLFT